MKVELDNSFGFPQTTVTPDNHCPACGARSDRASHTTEQVSPKPGDFCVCIRCASVARFDRSLRLRVASDDLVRRFCQREPERGRELRRVQRAILAIDGDAPAL